MKKVIFSFAVIAVSASAILAVNASRNLDSLIETNAEALARSEVTLNGHCEEEMNDCIAQCNTCKRWFYAPGKPGGSYNMDNECSECASKH